MAYKLLFNPFTGKFDYVNDTSAFAAPVPQTVANAVTYTVSDNTQVVFANQIVTNSGGIVLTEGTGAITWLS